MRWGTLTNLAIILVVSGILLFMVFIASLERAGVDARVFQAELIVNGVEAELRNAADHIMFWNLVRKTCRKHPGLRLIIYERNGEILGGCGEALVPGPAKMKSVNKREISVVSKNGFPGPFSERLVLVDTKGGFPDPAYMARFIIRLPPSVFSDSLRFFAAYLALTQISLFILGYLMFHRMIIGPIKETAKLAAKTAGLTNDQEQPSQESKVEDIQTITRSLLAMIQRIQANKEDMERLLGELKEANKNLAAAQEGLIRSEKLASAGRLAAGVAHEVGNPLQIVIGYIELLNDESDPDQRKDILARVDGELSRIDAILSRLLDFAKPIADDVVKTDLNELVMDSGMIIDGRRGFRQVEIKYDIQENLPPILTEPEKVRQILVNLILNSVDAMEDAGGVIILSTRYLGDRIELGVQDSGPGITADIKQKIFDPFFTTKDPGRGTGLGLAVCQSLAESIDATLEIESDGINGTAAILSFHSSLGANNNRAQSQGSV